MKSAIRFLLLAALLLAGVHQAEAYSVGNKPNNYTVKTSPNTGDATPVAPLFYDSVSGYMQIPDNVTGFPVDCITGCSGGGGGGGTTTNPSYVARGTVLATETLYLTPNHSYAANTVIGGSTGSGTGGGDGRVSLSNAFLISGGSMRIDHVCVLANFPINTVLTFVPSSAPLQASTYADAGAFAPNTGTDIPNLEAPVEFTTDWTPLGSATSSWAEGCAPFDGRAVKNGNSDQNLYGVFIVPNNAQGGFSTPASATVAAPEIIVKAFTAAP